MEVMGSLPK